MKKSVRKNGKVSDYSLKRRNGDKNHYGLYVDGFWFGEIIKTPKSKSRMATWSISAHAAVRMIQLDGFCTRTAAVEAALKLNGYELV